MWCRVHRFHMYVFYEVPIMFKYIEYLKIWYFFFLQAVLDKTQHSISYTLSRTEAVIVEYVNDENTDMFQVIIIYKLYILY